MTHLTPGDNGDTAAKALAQAVAAGISARGLMQMVQDIAAFGTRSAGSSAEAAAAAYIRDRLSRWGVQADVALFDAYIHVPASASVVVADGAGTRLHAGGVAFSAGTDETGIQAELADLRAGESPAGKIALVDGLTHYDVCLRAHAQGALGVIGIASDPHAHQWQISPLWGPPTGTADIARLSPLPAAQVGAEDGARLRAAAKDRVPVRLTAPVDAGWRPVRMPYAEIPGQLPGFVLIGGHLCSWGPGATDNATGNAIMLEIARLLAEQAARGEKPRYGVRFCWWTGHEQGGYAGSTWYADTHWAALRQDGIAYINVDNVGSRGASLKMAQNTTGELSAFVNALIDEIVGNPQAEQETFKGWLKRADAYIDRSRCGRNGDQSFSGIGLATAQISSYMPVSDAEQIRGSGMGWWWHTQDDTDAYADPAVLAVDALLTWRLVHGLTNGDGLPLRLGQLADDVLSSLREYEEAPGAALVPELQSLRAHALTFQRAAQDWDRLGDTLPERHDEAYERLTVRVLKQVNPVLHHASSDYEYDISRESRLLPGLRPVLSLDTLDGDGQRMAHVGIRRKIHRINDALIAASRTIASSLQQRDRSAREASRP